MLLKFRKCENGATAIEYGLIAALIAVTMIPAASEVGLELKMTFSQIAGALHVR